MHSSDLVPTYPSTQFLKKSMPPGTNFGENNLPCPSPQDPTYLLGHRRYLKDDLRAEGSGRPLSGMITVSSVDVDFLTSSHEGLNQAFALHSSL